MPRVPSNVLVGSFDSREDAEEARRELAERGFGVARAVDEGSHHPEDPRIVRRGGLTDLIENMFGGFVDHPDYDQRSLAEPGNWTIVAHVPPERHDDARAVLSRRGRVQTRIGRSPPARAVAAGGEVLLFGPNAMALPNAPTNWNAGRGDNPPSIPGSLDPGRPRGLLEDAAGLDPDYHDLRRTNGGRG